MKQTIDNLLRHTRHIEVRGGLVDRFAPVCGHRDSGCNASGTIHCEKPSSMGISRWIQELMIQLMNTMHFVKTLKLDVAEIHKPNYVAVKMIT